MTFEEFKAKYQKVPVEEYPNNVLAAVPHPMVSVTVSVYNQADYIRGCLDSILQQEAAFPFEVLIGEDQSNDGTREICIEYAEQYPDLIRLFLHRRENNIHIDGRPTGKFQATYTRFLSRGRYFTVLDGDDYWIHPQKLQIQVDNLEKNPDFSMNAGTVVNLQQDGETGLFKRAGCYKPNTIKDSYSFHEVVKCYSLHYSSFMFRTGLVDFPEWALQIVNGDEVLLALYADKGPIGFIDEELSAYRLHDQGIWVGQDCTRQLSQSIETFQVLGAHFQGKHSKTILMRHQSNLEFSVMKESLRSGRRSALRLLEFGVCAVPELGPYARKLRQNLWRLEGKKFINSLLIKGAVTTRTKRALRFMRGR